MARVLVPVVPRRYNHNSRGSSTATVVMRAENPFERSLAGPEGLVRTASQLPGMGFWGLGDDSTPSPSNGPVSNAPLMFMQNPTPNQSSDAMAVATPPAIQQLQSQGSVPMQTTPAQSTGFDWSGLTKSLINAGQTVALPIIQNNLAKHQQVNKMVAPMLMSVAPKKTSTTTYIMIGVGVIGAALALTMILKKRK